MDRLAFKKLDDMRWALVEKKYKIGLSTDEHDKLDWLAAFTTNAKAKAKR